MFQINFTVNTRMICIKKCIIHTCSGIDGTDILLLLLFNANQIFQTVIFSYCVESLILLMLLYFQKICLFLFFTPIIAECWEAHNFINVIIFKDSIGKAGRKEDHQNAFCTTCILKVFRIIDLYLYTR